MKTTDFDGGIENCTVSINDKIRMYKNDHLRMYKITL